MRSKPAQDGHPSGEGGFRGWRIDQGEPHQRADFTERDNLDPYEGEMSRQGEDRPVESRETFAEPENERDGLPRLGMPGEQEPVCGGSEDDHLDRREDRRRQRGKGKRGPGPRLDGGEEAGESNDVAPIP